MGSPVGGGPEICEISENPTRPSRFRIFSHFRRSHRNNCTRRPLRFPVRSEPIRRFRGKSDGSAEIPTDLADFPRGRRDPHPTRRLWAISAGIGGDFHRSPISREVCKNPIRFVRSHRKSAASVVILADSHRSRPSQWQSASTARTVQIRANPHRLHLTSRKSVR